MDTTIIYRVYIGVYLGIMENNMDTTIVYTIIYRVYIGVI